MKKLNQVSKLAMVAGLAIMGAMASINANAVDGTISMSATVPFAVNVPSYTAPFTVTSANYSTADYSFPATYSLWTNANQDVIVNVAASNYDTTSGYPYMVGPSNSEIPIDIQFQACGTPAPSVLDITPKGRGATGSFVVPSANGTQAVCTAHPGALSVTRLAMTSLPPAGSYAGSVTLTVQQPA